MTTERFDIIVREDGAKEVDRRIRNIGSSAKDTGNAVSKLNNLLRGVIAGGIVEKLRQYADTYTNLQNRLKLVTTNTAQLTVVQQKLFDISQRTRSSLPANVELFTRLAFATKELGVSQGELLGLTERINKAIVISGANTQEAQNALIQFSQGLSSGALQGEELRSVLEQLPRVADVIAKQLGVLNPNVDITRAALKKLGSEGKITAEVVLAAFKNFGGTLDEEFSRTSATIGQSLLQLNNAFLKSFGELDAKIGISSGIVAAIDFIRQNLDTLGRIAIATGLAISVGLVANGLKKAVIALKDLAFYIVKNPFAFLAQSIVVATSLLAAFSDRITISKDGLVTLQDFGKAAFDVLIGGTTEATKATKDSTDAVNQLSIDGSSAFDTIGKFVIGVVAALVNAKDSVGIFYETMVLGYRQIVVSFGNLPTDFKIIFTEAINAAIQIVEDGVNRIGKSISSVTEFVGAGSIAQQSLGRLSVKDDRKSVVNDPRAIEAFNRIKELQNNKDSRVDNLNKLFDSIKDRAKEISSKRVSDAAKNKADEEAATKALNDALAAATKPTALAGGNGSGGGNGGGGAANDNQQRISLKDTLADIQQQGKLLQLNNREREVQNQLINIENQFKQDGIPLNESEKQLLESRLKNLQALNDQAQVYDEIKGPLLENQQTQEALNKLYEDGKISVDEYSQAMNNLKVQALETDRTLEGGLQRGLGKISEEFGNVSNVAEDLVVNAFGKAEDALVQFVETGKLNVKDLVSSITADLSKLAVRQLITAPLAGALGLGGGGGAGGIASLFGGGGGGSPLETASSPAGNLSYTAASSAADSGGFLSSLSGLFGFKDGGQFQVGGQGGTDSQLVAFKASPDETVTVTKPGQGNQGGNITINIQTPDAASFQKSQGQVLSQFATNLARTKKRMT